MLPRDKQRLSHILDYCNDIQEHIKAVDNSHDAFLSDIMCQHSVAFCILQIGELVSALSEELRASTANQINWSAIKGMRNIVVHDYGHVDLEVVWSVAAEDIPILKKFCKEILES